MTIILFIHVTFGTLAVLLGFLAITVRKGSKLHRKAGKGFVLTMLVMALCGGIMGLQLGQTINVMAAGLTCYLVITAWQAATTQQVVRTPFSIVGFVFILSVALTGFIIGFQAMNSPEKTVAGFDYVAYFFIASIALLGGILDSYMLIKKRLNGKQKLVRHIWRMSFSYFIAAGSLFTGPGAKAFPEYIQQTGVLDFPEPLILVFMLYWIVKTKFGKSIQKRVDV